jgi:hypothetical protein
VLSETNCARGKKGNKTKEKFMQRNSQSILFKMIWQEVNNFKKRKREKV